MSDKKKPAESMVVSMLTPNSVVVKIDGNDVRVALDRGYYGYVYLTKCIPSGKSYIGQHAGRFERHYFGSGVVIKHAIKKYGKPSFIHDVLEFCSTREALDNAEIDYISIARNRGIEIYNLSSGGEHGASGCIRSPETLARMSKAQKGHAVSEETRRNISLANKGRVMGPEWRMRLGLAGRGKVMSASARLKISMSHKKRFAENGHHQTGSSQSEETKKKISEALKGRIFTPEWRLKISEAKRKNKKDAS